MSPVQSSGMVLTSVKFSTSTDTWGLWYVSHSGRGQKPMWSGLMFWNFKNFNQLLIFYSLNFYLLLSVITGAQAVAVWQTFQGRHTSHYSRKGPMTDQSNTCIEWFPAWWSNECLLGLLTGGWVNNFLQGAEKLSSAHTKAHKLPELCTAGHSWRLSGTLFRAHRQFYRLTVQESPLSTVLLVRVV